MRLRVSRTIPILIGLAAFAVLAARPDPVLAQTPFVPYYGKNRVRYDKFDWHIYKTDHFEIYYYPELEPHLARVASYAESAYQHISSTLKHDMPDKIPLIVFKTASEFEEQNVSGDELPEGVLAFTEPERGRMVLPIDLPSDQLYQLITHEMTHAFMFDIVPRGILGANLPLWVDEGLADYMAGAWNPEDLMSVRDAAITDTVPRMSELESEPLEGREPYELGHAAFDFIEAKWGLDGLRSFLFSLRKSVLGSGQTAYEEALKLRPDEFDDQFDSYLKQRFKPFRDKERPTDYGRNLSPDPRKTPFVSTASIAPSPSGELIGAMVGNYHDYELDIVLLSAKDGQVVRNLTQGFDKDRGFEYISVAGGLRGNMVPWFAWAPVGDHVAYFARTEKDKTLIIQDVVTDKIVKRWDLKSVDEPESPAFSPDGKTIVFSALRNAVTDLFTIDLTTGKITDVTNDAVADYSPTYSPDGRSIVYSVHVGGNDKLFELDLATGQKKQLTFGTHDDTCPSFYDDHTVLFTSTGTDPNVPLAPEVARNGTIPNVWTLDLQTNVLKQWTDTATANLTPIVLRQTDGPPRVAFVTYYKGDFGLHAITLTNKPIATVDSADFGSPGPVVDFQPPLTETVLPDNIRKKGAWEKMSLEGRPPIGLGVTSGGNFYGNTQLTFEDVLGDKQVSFFAQSVAQYRTTALSYVNIGHRIQYALQGFSEDEFYYGENAALFDPSVAPEIANNRDLAQFVTSQRGGTAFVIYPFNRYRRMELFGGYVHLTEQFNDPNVQLAEEEQAAASGQQFLANGNMLPIGVAFVQETTVFRDFGPIAGTTLRLQYQDAPPVSASWVSRQTIDGDARYYMRIAANGVLALRLRGLQSWGPEPSYLAFGGNSEMHGYQYLEFIGQKGFFADAELRFPLIDAMLTPFGVVGGLRGTFFFNISGAALNGTPFTFFSSKTQQYSPIVGYQTVDVLGDVAPVFGAPVTISGPRLVDGRASYGFGLESFLLGFPMHFDFSWRTLFNQQWEDALFASDALAAGYSSGHVWFRQMQFGFWIGYDF